MERKKVEVADQLRDKTIAMVESSLQFDYYDFYGHDNILKLKNLLLMHITP